MTKYKSIRNGICATIMAVTPILLSAQIVKHDRLLSFESAEVPSFISGTNSGLSISDQHYKDGTHSLQWKFQPGSSITIDKDLKKKIRQELINICQSLWYGYTMKSQ